MMASPDSRLENSIEDPHWRWPIYDVFEDHENVDGRAQAGSSYHLVRPFHVTYMRAMGGAWPELQVVLFSQALIDIVRELLPKNKTLVEYAGQPERPSVSVEELYGVLHSLMHLKTRWLRSNVGEDIEGFMDLKHLVRSIKLEYGNKPVRYRRMTKEKRVAFGLLQWFILGLVVYKCHITNEIIGAQVKSTHYRHTPDGWMFEIELMVYDFNGRKYRPCSIIRTIHTYVGDRPFVDLPAYPIDMAEDPKAMQRRLLLGGRVFRDLMMTSTSRLFEYSGTLFSAMVETSGWSISKTNVDGRVVIDLESFRRMNPEYQMGHASPILEALDYRRDICTTYPPIVPIDASDEVLMLAPAIVYGFSLTAKKWGCFAVRYFTKVVFDKSAVESLRMASTTKCIVRALVSGYTVTRSLSQAIPEGLGCFFICCGEVDTTLTATSIAESLGRPLWVVSSAGLGSTPDELKDSLLTILYVGKRWGAVLLFEGADIYLDNENVGPKSLASMFLRTVTLYPSVLFISTTRPQTRLPSDVYWISIETNSVHKISLILSCHRKKLTINQRKQIWADLLHQVGVLGVVEDFASEVAEIWNLTIDGIRGAVCRAQQHAYMEVVDLNVEHVRHQLPMMSRYAFLTECPDV